MLEKSARIGSDAQIHAAMGNFVSELAGGLIFATTRLSARGSSRVDTARIFLVADFNNRLPLRQGERGRKKNGGGWRARKVARIWGARWRLSHCLYVTTSLQPLPPPPCPSFNPSAFTVVSCSFVTFDLDTRNVDEFSRTD